LTYGPSDMLGRVARLPTSFYVVAFVAVTFSVAALVLSIQTEGSGYAAAAGLIAAAGGFATYLLLKRRK
jgi:hypothetical protein